MARFTHPAIVRTGASDLNSWVVEGGTDEVQPTFDGDPLFLGHYQIVGDLCHFTVEVNMDNITDFGEGQYYIKLPVPTHHAVLLSDGCLHDISGDDQYAILGHADAGSDILKLFSIGSNGRHEVFSSTGPVGLDVEDNFHIAGIYEIDH
jgi:hypothetical protein